MSDQTEPSSVQKHSIEVVKRVTSAFLIIDVESVTNPLRLIVNKSANGRDNLTDAIEGLSSVVSAATLPFQLVTVAVQQRRFDRVLSAERIRSLKEVPRGEKIPDEIEMRSANRARFKMNEFAQSALGVDFFRDATVEELNRSLDSDSVFYAARELMTQALVSTWAVFEHFSAAFIVDTINSHPKLAKKVIALPNMKGYFGKQSFDIESLDEHGYDLTQAMGSMIFRTKRLDNLTVLRSVFSALFDEAEIRNALSDDLWMLNQKRHLLVHKRGLVDREYLERTGDRIELGARLTVTSEDVEGYLLAVQRAIVAIAAAGVSMEG